MLATTGTPLSDFEQLLVHVIRRISTPGQMLGPQVLCDIDAASPKGDILISQRVNKSFRERG